MSEQPDPGGRGKAPRVVQGEKLRGAAKLARIPVKIIPSAELPRKPDWILSLIHI